MSLDNVELNIIVIGAGLAGLTTAWALTTSGHNVTVFERSAQLNTGGTDIQIAPNAVRCLDKLGLLQHIQHAATPISHVEYRNWHSMDVLSRRMLNPRQDYGSMMFRRDDLIYLLYENAVQKGVKVIFNTQIVALSDEAPFVVAKSGEKFLADLIVGADGVRSTLRSLMFPDRDTKPIVTDTACFQFCVPYDIMTKDPETLEMWNSYNGLSLQLGDGKYITSWRNEHQQALCVIFSQRHYKKPLAVDDWTRKGDLNEVLQLYSDYPSAILKLIRDMDVCEKWRIVDAVEGADWISKSGKVALVGDAIHAMPPHAAQGFSQGIEDAASLGKLLKGLGGVHQLPTLLKGWADMRAPRAAKIQAAARATLVSLTLPDGPAQRARDEALRRAASIETDTESWNGPAPRNMTANMTERDFLRWVYRYDVVEEASEISASVKVTS